MNTKAQRVTPVDQRREMIMESLTSYLNALDFKPYPNALPQSNGRFRAESFSDQPFDRVPHGFLFKEQTGIRSVLNDRSCLWGYAFYVYDRWDHLAALAFTTQFFEKVGVVLSPTYRIMAPDIKPQIAGLFSKARAQAKSFKALT